MQVKGTRDLDPHDVLLREEIFNKIKPYFTRYGAVPIDTPVMECMSTVQDLYGEEFEKLVYTLDDQGGQKLLLRYDLTVPLARYINNNGLTVFRAYRIGKVYRRDVPQISKGRYREFYQADFDIVGEHHNKMIQEAEILHLLIDILENLLGEDTFTIQVNDRRILYWVLDKCGISESLHHTVCSALDKLDKIGLDGVLDELEKKRIDTKQIGLLLGFLSHAELNITLDDFLKGGYIEESVKLEMEKLFKYMGDRMKYIQFTPNLARGLDYYTGLIYEVTYNDKEVMGSSIAAGGRYDKMLGKLGHRGDIPAIGVSLGIERIATILQSKSGIDIQVPLVYVATVGKGMLDHKVALCLELRRNGIYTDMSHGNKLSMRVQLDDVLDKGIPYMIVIGGREVENGVVQLKTIATKEQVEINRKEVVDYLLNL